MDSQKQQASERIKQANNILVTVSTNPSVDQLAACIGLTIALNKMGKHATAVFSGAVPSTIEFLQPEKTLEKNTDSLRDFIIALDKSKADKLRYKVEDRVVKIFITPYKTSISEKDLEFSQGDFNVDVVLALGVHSQAELDQAITSHGRILHDATVITLNTKTGGELGSINWLDVGASSLSELGVQLLDLLDKKLIDTQIATALLTGIVAETDRFSNSKTSPQTMSLSAELMAAGANQQLVATKLEEAAPASQAPVGPIAQQDEGEHKEVPPETKKPDDGTLEISHEDKQAEAQETPPEAGQGFAAKEAELAPQLSKPEEPTLPQPQEGPETPEPQKPEAPQIHIDEHGSLQSLEDMLPPKSKKPPTIIHHNEPPKMVIEPLTLGNPLTADATPGSFSEAGNGVDLPGLEAPAASSPTNPVAPPQTVEGELPSGSAPADSFIVGQPAGESAQPGNPPDNSRTLTDIEKEVHSPHTTTPANDAASVANPSPPVLAVDPILPTPDNPPATTNGIPVITPPEPSSTTEDNNQNASTPDLDSARDAVMQAINASPSPALDPIHSLNAQPVDLPIGSQANDTQSTPSDGTVAPAAPPDSAAPAAMPSPSPVIQPQFDALAQNTPSQPQFGIPTAQFGPAAQGQATDPSAPPPGPPPMMPPPTPY